LGPIPVLSLPSSSVFKATMGRVVITGCSGVVGTAIVAYAMQFTKHHLVLVDLKPPSPTEEQFLKLKADRVERHSLDLRDFTTWTRVMQGADALVHLAAFAQPVHAPPHVTHNTNVILSYNALQACVEAGVKRVVMAGSINAIGGCYNEETPRWRYLPLDEDHPSLAEEPYSLSKYVSEVQADSVARSHPSMSIATLRFHFVTENRPSLGHCAHSARKDMWGWTDAAAAARSCFLALEMRDRREHHKSIKGHEVFFIVGPTHCAVGYTSMDLAQKFFPGTKLTKDILGENEGFFSCRKAETVLGWRHDGGTEPVGDW